MSIIDRMNIPNSVFVSTVLSVFAKARNIPATALGEMQIAGVLRELFGVLGGNDELAAEYTSSVLRRQPCRKTVILSDALRRFMDNPVDHGLVHKYKITEDDLVTSWTFECLDDPSIMEKYSIGASVECEHHRNWKKDKDRPSDEDDKHEFHPPKKEDFFELDDQVKKPAKTDSLMEL